MVISLQMLEASFFPVEPLGNGIVRCADELRDRTIYSYFRLQSDDSTAPFVVSDNLLNDDFAQLVLNAFQHEPIRLPTKSALADNAYGFSHIVWAPASHHNQLKGRQFDRDLTVLGLPIHYEELSGRESPQDLAAILNRTLAIERWNRAPQPKLSLRFDNPRTKAGTGDGYVFADFDLVRRELDNLAGAPGGFIELINVDDAVVEVACERTTGSWLRRPREILKWIENRNDETAIEVTLQELASRLTTFAEGRTPASR